MAERTLRSTVVLSGENEGDPPLVLTAGTTPTKEQAKLIDNPKAWDDYDPDTAERSPVTRPAPLVADDSGQVEGDSPKPAKKAAAKKSTAKKK